MSLYIDSSSSRHVNTASSAVFSPLASRSSRPSYRTMQLTAQEAVRNTRRRVPRTAASESAAKENGEVETSEAAGAAGEIDNSSSSEAAIDLTNAMFTVEELVEAYDEITDSSHRIDQFMSSFLSTRRLMV